VLIFLLRILLIWWILSILFKWLGRLSSPDKKTSQAPQNPPPETNPNIMHSGKIEDAEYEELDHQ